MRFGIHAFASMLFAFALSSTANATVITSSTDWANSLGDNVIVPFPQDVPSLNGTTRSVFLGCDFGHCLGESFTVELPYEVMGVLADFSLGDSYGHDWLYLGDVRLPEDPPGSPDRCGGTPGLERRCLHGIYGFVFDAPTSVLEFTLYPFGIHVDDYLMGTIKFLSVAVQPTAVPEPGTFYILFAMLIGVGLLKLRGANEKDRGAA